MRRRLLVLGLLGVCLGVPAQASARVDVGPRLAVPQQMRLVAYYPAHDGWTYMWQHWDPRQIDHDFGLVANLHANTVRIFVQPSVWGFPHPSRQGRQQLETVLSLAGKHGLAVELTLFDWWFDYGRVADSKTWVRSLLSGYADDPRIAAIELRNEIDPSNPAAIAWAKALLPYVRQVLPETPVTLSVSSNDPVNRLAALSSELAPVAPDFWSFHYYDKPEYALWTIAAARAAVAPVPLVVGETGYEPNLSAPQPKSPADIEAEQSRYFRTVANAAALLGLPPPGVWVLLDFSPGASPVAMPQAEYRFGLFRTDGTPKPDASVVRSMFLQAGTVDPSFDGGFERPGFGPWRVHGSGATREAVIVHGGAGSVALTPAGGRTTLTTIPSVPWVTPGQTLSVSGWVRGILTTGTTEVELRWFAADRTPLGVTDSEALPSGTVGWTLLTASGQAPPGAAFVAIALISDGNSGSAVFDDVSLAAG
ncbi:MAG TPA: hypothetical protein VHD91_13060 [Gaiellaceae bacterium]|nr:hypothetical protein [Gaiellaceae bacterium]